MGNLISRLKLIAAVLGLLILQHPAAAQEAPPDLFGGGADTSALVGLIPGSDMLRDEFRARAIIQLKAVALNALAYRLANEDEYPQSFYELKGSKYWNLDVLNMFTGNPIKDIYFEPDKDDMTTRLVLDLPLNLEEDEGNLGAIDLEGGDNIESLGTAIQSAAPSTLPRIDPQKVRTFRGGDLLYYVRGDMLQLVLYAPDGTYLEHVDVKPNGHWRRQLNTAGNQFWPDSIGAAQVLFFAELVPQHHNLAEFMGNRETLPPTKFKQLSALERLDLARELDIIVLNPISHAAAVSQVEFSLGNFAASTDPTGAALLSLFMRDGQAWTREMLTADAAAASGSEPAPEEPGRKPPADNPPLGGRS